MECNTGLADTPIGTPNAINVPGICTKVDTKHFERNALTAKIVQRAQDYRWGSLYNWNGGKSVIKISPWPVKRLPRWIERVNQPLTKKESDAVKHSIVRGSPFGQEQWVTKIAKQDGLESTLRPRGRPKKLPQNTN